MTEDLFYKAKQWVSHDPNPSTKHHIVQLITRLESNDTNTAARDELASLFSNRIGFGTAGLRGRMQPGPLGMNDLVVIQTAQGLASYIKRNAKEGDVLRTVVGYDHRAEEINNLSSKQFGMYTKLVFQQAGIECILLDGYVATPLLAFSVTALNASVGIMVTASHNPKADNGYKVYWSNGCQIVPPIDEDIANSITEECNLIPWIDYGAKLQRLKSDASSSCFGLSDTLITKQMEDEYFAVIESSGLISKDALSSNNSSQPKFAYTAMHGVGHPYAKHAFETFNIPPFHVVPSQCTPDPEFPTVSFPNPEEEGALNEAMDFALKMGCQIVLANDPDADRLGVAEYSNSKWTVFTGDQIGILLGVWLWETVGKTSDKVSHLI
jgi:phosphomannomutase